MVAVCRFIVFLLEVVYGFALVVVGFGFVFGIFFEGFRDLFSLLVLGCSVFAIGMFAGLHCVAGMLFSKFCNHW